jgi:hypothetical protein
MAAPPPAARLLLIARTARHQAAFWFVIASATMITSLHYLTDAHLIPHHSIYRSLYYVPIAVAAVRYGRRGGALTALIIALVYIPHVLLSWGTMPTDGLNDLLETRSSPSQMRACRSRPSRPSAPAPRSPRFSRASTAA